jgi:hypothetical protein
MFFRETLPFIKDFIALLSEALEKHSPKNRLSLAQKGFLSFCLMGIVVTNTVCWARFERASLKERTSACLCWMFRCSRIPWNLLFRMGIRVILWRYGIDEGVLVVDDSDHKRAKKTTRIHLAHKIFDKKTNGYFNGQTIVFLVLVSNSITIPVGFAFYSHDPVLKAWEKEDKKLCKKKVKKANRPPKPIRNPKFPTKEKLAVELLSQFAQYHSEVKVNAVNGDNHYSTASFISEVERIFERNTQVISCLKLTQKVQYKNKYISVQNYFAKQNKPIKQKIRKRGGELINVELASARLKVYSHRKKRFLIAIRYEGQENFTYVCASNLTWRTKDITETWTLRWLVEVFIEDFKEYEGWGQLAKQQGAEGSSRGLILSLLCDLALFLHPSQEASFKNKRPAFTVGSLLRKSRAEATVEFFKEMVVQKEGQQKLNKLYQKIEEVFELKPSKKHMSGRESARMEPTPSLIRHAHVN